jgi:glycopeptide antibiotics resistance protein
LWKRPSLGLLIGYAFLILAETVLIRKPFSGQHFNPELFWSWRQWKIQRNQILTNVIMFLPVGVLAGSIWRWKGLGVAAGLSAAIEILQLVTSRGLCEFDDVFHNMIGAVIGVGIVMLMRTAIDRSKTEAENDV